MLWSYGWVVLTETYLRIIKIRHLILTLWSMMDISQISPSVPQISLNWDSFPLDLQNVQLLFWRVHPQDIPSRSPCGNHTWDSSIFLLYWPVVCLFLLCFVLFFDTLFCSLLSCQWPLLDLAQCLHCACVHSAVSRIMLLAPYAQRGSSQMRVGALVTHSSFFSILPLLLPAICSS